MSKRKMSDIFRNITAWFSTSVDVRYEQLWVENGGIVVADFSKGLYVFSDDPETPDTKSLFNSSAYVDGLTILMPSFIDACLQGGDMHKTKLSCYILHSTEVAEVLSSKMKIGHPSKKRNESESESTTSKCNIVWTKNLTLTATDAIEKELDFVPHVKNVPKFVGVLEELIPGRNGFEITKV